VTLGYEIADEKEDKKREILNRFRMLRYFYG